MQEVRHSFFRRSKSCPFSGKNALTIDYKDVKLLSRFISERGKIVPEFPLFPPKNNVNWQKPLNGLVF